MRGLDVRPEMEEKDMLSTRVVSVCMFENRGTRFGDRTLKIEFLAVQETFEAHAPMAGAGRCGNGGVRTARNSRAAAG